MARLAPRLADFGVTRVARITGFDRTGVEVFTAVRPNARALSVANGKGVDPPPQGSRRSWRRSSAGMPSSRGRRSGSARRTTSSGSARPVALGALPRRRAGPPGPIIWAEAVDLATGAPALVPFDLVHTCWLADLPEVGLLHLDERARLRHPSGRRRRCTALCELIEQDPLSLFERLPPEAHAARRIDPVTVAEPAVAALLDRLAGAASGWRSGMPRPTSASRRALRAHRPPRAAYARRLRRGLPSRSRAVATLRAITEAAQTRVIAITGTRDDLGPTSIARRRPALSLGNRGLRRGAPSLAEIPPRCGTPAGRPAAVVAAVTRGRLRAGARGRSVPRAPALGDAHARPRPRARRHGRRGRPGTARRAAQRCMSDERWSSSGRACGDRLAALPGVAFRRPRRRPATSTAPRARGAGDRPHRRRLRGPADGLAQGDPLGARPRRAGLRRRQPRGAPGGRVRALRDGGRSAGSTRWSGAALEDDHELALAYAPERARLQPLSEPLVNVRAIARRRVAAGVLAATDGARRSRRGPRRCRSGRSPGRRYRRHGRRRHAPGFEAWLPAGRVDLKRADALALVDAVAGGAGAARCRTDRGSGSTIRATGGRRSTGSSGRASVPAEADAVLDELRLDPTRYERALVRAYARRAPRTRLAGGPSWRTGRRSADRHGLGSADAYRDWRSRTGPSRRRSRPRSRPRNGCCWRSMLRPRSWRRRCSTRFASTGVSRRWTAARPTSTPDSAGARAGLPRGRARRDSSRRSAPAAGSRSTGTSTWWPARSGSRIAGRSSGCSRTSATTTADHAEDRTPGMTYAAPRPPHVRVRIFPQSPLGGGVPRLETIEVRPRVGSVGPGPSDRRMYTIDAPGKRPYGPGGRPALPPWKGADGHAGDTVGAWSLRPPGTRRSRLSRRPPLRLRPLRARRLAGLHRRPDRMALRAALRPARADRDRALGQRADGLRLSGMRATAARRRQLRRPSASTSTSSGTRSDTR